MGRAWDLGRGGLNRFPRSSSRKALLWWPTVTTLTSLHSGHDVAYFLREREAGDASAP
jgi:hypothetical protein